MKKISLITFGCRVNQYESDAISESLAKEGYEIVGSEENADVIIINTCAVTAEAEAKCRKAIRHALRIKEKTGARVCVLGCFSQGSTGDEALFGELDYVSGNTNKGDILKYLPKLFEGYSFDRRTSISTLPYENLAISSCKYVKAYVKIEDGCNNFCTYCYVPYVRGRVRSRDSDEIISEIQRLSEKNYREIILTGIETSSFGEDKGIPEALADLVERITLEAPVERLRFGSLNPAFFTKERTQRLASLGVMPHFHLSVQSASGDVLKAMGRKYNEDILYSAVENIRQAFPNANLSCDMICGFPTEREKDFQKSLDFIKEARILHTHVFPYSKRENTRALQLQSVVSDAEKHLRAKAMVALASRVHEEIFASSVGQTHSVLLEFFRGGKAMGYTENFINLCFTPDVSARKGDVVDVKITEHMDNSH